MIRCMIVDDEKPARDELKFLLEDYEDIQVICETDNGRDASNLQKTNQVELVFLDINMPVVSGIRVAEKWMVQENPPMIVFTTAYDDYAIQAFELNAVDYLLKPICPERLKKAIGRIREKSVSLQRVSVQAIIEKMGQDKTYGMDKICLESAGRFIPVDISDIIYATIIEKQTIIHTVKGEFQYGHSLSYLKERLHSERFIRTHRAYLMNIDFVEAIEPWFNNTYMVKMKDCEEKVPVARNQVKAFKEAFQL